MLCAEYFNGNEFEVKNVRIEIARKLLPTKIRTECIHERKMVELKGGKRGHF